MAVFTLAEVDEQLAAWKKALLKVSTGQKYIFGGRALTRANLTEIRQTLDWLSKEKAALEGKAVPAVTVARVRR